MHFLDQLESESIHILREAIAEAQNPVMLYSVGKDSSVLLRLAQKAFSPGKLPFSLLHVDTRWKFRDMYAFRDALVQQLPLDLHIYTNPAGIRDNVTPFTRDTATYTRIMKTEALKQALDHYQFDIILAGARRDEEKSRAKERIFSFRNPHHEWNPRAQRPELWSLYNVRKNPQESIRVFPLSNWTELDIWHYIERENIPLVPLYFAANHPVVKRGGQWIMVDDERLPLPSSETIVHRHVRFRTLGCYPLTEAIESSAKTVADIIQEIGQSRQSERAGRLIDKDTQFSMENKKREGYF